jgi:hypothetical protein
MHSQIVSNQFEASCESYSLKRKITSKMFFKFFLQNEEDSAILSFLKLQSQFKKLLF